MRYPITRSAALALAVAACATERSKAQRGSPPNTDVGARAAVVVTEVMADPRAVADETGEWFELFNSGQSPVDLRGWTIGSGSDAAHVIARSVVIPGRGYAVLARSGDSERNGGVAAAYEYSAGPTALTLGNGAGDWLVVRDPSGATVDSVAWGAPPPRGASRALRDPALDNVSRAVRAG